MNISKVSINLFFTSPYFSAFQFSSFFTLNALLPFQIFFYSLLILSFSLYFAIVRKYSSLLYKYILNPVKIFGWPDSSFFFVWFFGDIYGIISSKKNETWTMIINLRKKESFTGRSILIINPFLLYNSVRHKKVQLIWIKVAIFLSLINLIIFLVNYWNHFFFILILVCISIAPQ